MKNFFKKKQTPVATENAADGTDHLLPRLSLFVFNRSRMAAVLWLCLTVFGLLSYTTFMKREGFPPINIPYSIIGGAYIANDASKVDKEVTKPIIDIVLKEESVKSVQSQANGTSFSIAIEYKEGTNVDVVSERLEKEVKASPDVPKQAVIKTTIPKFGFTERGDDAVVTLYSSNPDVSTRQLADKGKAMAAYIKNQNVSSIKDASIIDPFVSGVNTLTGQQATSQTRFDRYGFVKDGQNVFYPSVSIGVSQSPGNDAIKLDDQLNQVVAAYNSQENRDSGYEAVVSASYAPDIKLQTGELQRALLEGLIAVLVIGSLVIAIRASIITVLSMITVLAIVAGVLFAIGYTLNTITLFALILCLGLIVDDTIIMVEALDAQRRRRTDPRVTIKEATRKVSRAMIAATFTAALSFAPLLFVGGILGGFIRAIPVTVITSLLVSLIVALVFIPLFARYLLLGKKQMGAENVHEPAAGIEAKIAQFLGKPMLWARNSTKKLFGVGLTAVLIGFLFIGMGGYLFSKVSFNIFPPSKDANNLNVNLAFNLGTSVEQAEEIADRADKIVTDSLGTNFKQASYYTTANPQSATLFVHIIPYSEREATANQLIDELKEDLKQLEGAQVKVAQADVGPPASAFTARIETTDRVKAMKLAQDINAFIKTTELKRPDGSIAKIDTTDISDPSTYTRADGKLYVEATTTFVDTDTTTLVTLAQAAVEKEFTPEKIATYGLDKNVLNFDFGQEDDNQESFKTLAIAFPILLLVIYLLLAIQFRSLLQPLLIFMAIPFSLFGITLGLYLSDNPFSFFAMLGFFALIGLSLKNTILLTDYANQLRRQGKPAVDAAVEALAERFRPLIATSLTAVVSLIPLALTSPFWEGLTIVLIGGLLSSTFLVIVVFPYYYLGAEFLRMHISHKAFFTWLGLSALSIAALVFAGMSKVIVFAPLLILVVQALLARRKRRTITNK